MLKFIKNCWLEDRQHHQLWIPVLFALGIGFYFMLYSEPSKWTTLAIIETLIIMAVLFRHRRQVLYVIGCFAIVVAGFTLIQIKAIWLSTASPQPPEQTSYYKGQIVAIDTNYQGRPRFVLNNLEDFDGNRYTGLYRITQRSYFRDISLGDCVELVGTISPLSTEVVTGGYQFDRKGYFEGLKGSGFAESRWFKTQCTIPDSLYFASFIADMRQNIVKRINNILPKEEAAIVSAIIAGERGSIDQTQYEQYRNSGLAHFLSISGLHMSMLAGLMFFLVRFTLALFPSVALRYDTKKIAAIFAIILSTIYLFISGQAIPAERAYIMTTVVLLGVLTNRRAISLHTICLAALIVLVLSPEVLISASFQMSFAAVLGLIAFYEKVSRPIQQFLQQGHLNRWIKIILLYIIGIIVSDFIASVMTLPFAIYHFNMIALYTTLGNFLAGPIIGLIIMPFVLLSMLLMPFGLEEPFLRVVGFGIEQINHITAFVASLPHAGYQISSMPHWGLILIVIGGLWLMLWQAKWRYWGIIAIICGLLSISLVRVPDIIISPQAKVFAFKNAQGELELTKSRAGRFIKNVWRNKYPVSTNTTTLESHPYIKISDDIITIKGQSVNITQDIGASIYYQKDGSLNIKTIRNDIGMRLWNI